MKASNNPFPSILLQEGNAPTAPAVGYQRLYLNSSNLNVINASNTIRVIGSGAGGSVGTDTIWDAAGDLAVGTGSDTASRLAIGAAGGYLSVINSAVAWNSGTSFPANKATGDRYWRTDLGREYYWDGTRWVTTQEFSISVSIQDGLWPITGSGTAYVELDNGTYDLWVTRIACSTTVVSTNDGTKYWTIGFYRRPSNTVLGSTFTTAADSAGTNTRHDVTVGALTGTSDRYVDIGYTKTSTPGNIYVIATLYYRMVAT